MQHQTYLASAGVLVVVVFVAAILLGGIFAVSNTDNTRPRAPLGDDPSAAIPEGIEKATFGSGCFWCTEAVFQELKGVYRVQSGYSGGHVKDPTYEQVCSGTTGHAEVVQVSFDPAEISYAELLEVFWHSHDPTTLNRQGNDVGTQYRSAIFYHNDQQRELAEHYQQQLDKASAFNAPIVTEIVPYRQFYPGESYHQNYYADNPRQPYCSVVIRPKVEKIKKVFQDKLRSGQERS
jgi:peptide-methionine (S)-S-oxide reductase